LCTLARFPFDEIAGVELSERLARIAERNARKLRLDNVKIHVSDAGDFTALDRFTHIYMFNPFPRVVMEQVMTNLAASFGRSRRTVTMIYCHPVCHDVVMASGLFRKELEIAFPSSLRYHVYVHDVGQRPIEGAAAAQTGLFDTVSRYSH
jgi:hypothetical protein